MHATFEGLGNIEEWSAQNGHLLSCTRVYENTDFPELISFDGLIIMGGPVGAYEEDQYPWLKAEKEFIRSTIKAGKKVLGICLGAQLIADVLGAKVFHNKNKEIGWFPVSFTPDSTNHPITGVFPETFMTFHWHGDTFTLPVGVTHLAYSEATPNQAFIYDNRVVALQFHPEVVEAVITDLTENGDKELIDAPYIQSKEEMKKGIENIRKNKEILFQFLNKLFQTY
jgi:GMP synthase-like glutamine amidotransferase